MIYHFSMSKFFVLRMIKGKKSWKKKNSLSFLNESSNDKNDKTRTRSAANLATSKRYQFSPGQRKPSWLF